MRLLLAFVFGLALALPLVAAAQRPVPLGTYIGAKSLSVTGSWADLTSSSFTCLATQAACPAGLVFSYLMIRNRDATDTAYLVLRNGTGGVGGTAGAVRIDAGGVLSDLQVYGVAPKTISIYGYVFGTDLEILAYFFPN